MNGKYAFFSLADQELLEFRPEKKPSLSRSSGEEREIYAVEYPKKQGLEENALGLPDHLTLFPVQVGTQGVRKLHKPAIFLAAYNPLEEAAPPVIEEPPAVFDEDSPVPVLGVATKPDRFSPDGDGMEDDVTLLLNVQSLVPVVQWSLEIREPQPPYQTFYQYEGQGKPPERLTWNGKSSKGELVQAATDYPFIFKAEDSQGGIGSFEGHIGVDVLVIREGEGLRIQVPSIIFRAGYADFLELPKETVDNNNRVLRRIAEILNKFRDYKVLVEGHANRTAVREAEALEEEHTELRPLSESRARAVVNYLIEFGVSRGRLSAVGMGSTKPIAGLEDRNNWWKNRRVEFILIK
jgi:flagellar motor protein MotB